MTDIAAIALTVGLLTVVSAVVFWLTSRADRRVHAIAAADSEAFRTRLANPDLNFLEKLLGHPLPESFQARYRDLELVMSADLLIKIPNPLAKDDESYIGRFQPAERRGIRASLSRLLPAPRRAVPDE